MNKKILIIGGTGFLGHKVYEHLNQIEGVDVACGSAHKKPEKENQIIRADMLDNNSLKDICKPFDTIINCTGQITEPLASCLKLNTIGIDNLVEALKNTNKFLIQISTVAVYGTNNEVSEDSPLNPETPYATCKLFSEYLLEKGLKPTQYSVLRLSNLYGDTKREIGIFAYLYKSFRSDRALEFDNNGELSRYYLHVDDCAEIISRLVLKQPFNGIFNIIGPKQYSIIELLDTLQNCQNIKFKVKYSNCISNGNIGKIDDRKIRHKIDFNYRFSVEKYFVKYFK